MAYLNSRPKKTAFATKQRLLLLFVVVLCGGKPMLRAQQANMTAARENVIVIESRHGIVCDTFTNGCTLTQMLVVTVGGRKLELRMYESKPEALLLPGSYPGQRVQGKSSSAYRLDEAYNLSFPDGKTERFDVVGVLQ